MLHSTGAPNLIKRRPLERIGRHTPGHIDPSSYEPFAPSPTGSFVVLMVLLFLSLGLVAFAIYAGITLNDIQSKTTAFDPTIASVSVNASCNTTATQARRTSAYQVRLDNAFHNYASAVPCHTNNGDEDLYSSTHFASFSKGLTHDGLGHVNPTAYAALLKAAQSGVPSDWDAIPLASGATRKLTNPQAGLGFVNEGGDPASFFVPPAPTFASAEQAGEIVEQYWMALARDVNFSHYGSDPITVQAVASIGALSDFRGPPVSAGTLFRGTAPGCSTGPYLSQFLYMPCAFGAALIDQRILPPTAGVDFMKNASTYLAQQNAQAVEANLTYGVNRVFIRNGRDLAHWVHIDQLTQAYYHALLVLLDIGAPLKPGIPYVSTSSNQMGFGTFGAPFFSKLVSGPPGSALLAAWYQKWVVHRRLRPEVFAARVHNHVTSAYTYPLHNDVLDSDVLAAVFAAQGTYFLSQAYPEGSPLHGSYAAGHATVAGCASTLLKAFFDEDYVLPDNVMPNPADGGQTVVPLSPSATLTVGHEINKLASNVAIGRNIAGVHWRSDANASLKLGEQVAITILRDMLSTFNEPFEGFTFKDFEGNQVVVQ